MCYWNIIIQFSPSPPLLITLRLNITSIALDYIPTSSGVSSAPPTNIVGRCCSPPATYTVVTPSTILGEYPNASPPYIIYLDCTRVCTRYSSISHFCHQDPKHLLFKVALLRRLESLEPKASLIERHVLLQMSALCAAARNATECASPTTPTQSSMH